MASTGKKTTKKNGKRNTKRRQPDTRERVFFNEVTSEIKIIDTTAHSPDAVEEQVNQRLAEGWSLNAASYELQNSIILYRYKLIPSKDQNETAENTICVIVDTERPSSWT